jgi:glycosyltransferase involved in cell wall biosynthesis
LQVTNPGTAPSAGSRTFGILSTYPPTACGIATFSAALARGLVGIGAEVRIVRIADDGTAPRGSVAGELVNGSAASVAACAALLDECDVAIVQHEYGLYGGSDGDELLDVLRALRVPSIVVAHTVPRAPTPHQRSVLEAVAALADRVVVMSDAARHRLCTSFDVDATRVITIPHGAEVPTEIDDPSRSGRPTLLTWGLLGPGKGIERVIDAMPLLVGLRGRPRYVVAGRTHPKVLATEGEAYRNELIARSWANGVAPSVTFDPSYRDVPSLTKLIRSAAVVVLPYDSVDQVTSGVLVDAVAAGRPVVATAFPHAVELLSSGAGIVVDHADEDAMAGALVRVLTEPGLASSMAAEAARIAPNMGWPVVARAYDDLGSRLLRNRRGAAPPPPQTVDPPDLARSVPEVAGRTAIV